MDDFVGLPYTPGSDTSRAAAEDALLTADRCRAIVLGILIEAGEDGKTHPELEHALFGRYAPSGVRTRCNELVKGGLARDSGKRRLSPYGKSAVVWVAVAQGQGRR